MVDKNIYIVQGEIATVVGAIKRNSRWNTHTQLVSSVEGSGTVELCVFTVFPSILMEYVSARCTDIGTFVVSLFFLCTGRRPGSTTEQLWPPEGNTEQHKR